VRRIPSVDRIEAVTGYDRDTAIQLRRILDGRDDPESFTKVARWVNQCFNRPSDVELKLAACDAVMDAHGIESLRSEDVWDRRWQDTVASYVNVGDSYYGTILYDVERGVFYATSTGDWIETAERNHRFKLR
jgi:hypothetical protein